MPAFLVRRFYWAIEFIMEDRCLHQKSGHEVAAPQFTSLCGAVDKSLCAVQGPPEIRTTGHGWPDTARLRQGSGHG
jgi:hypothetical protein